MITVRPDARERFEEIHSLITLLRDTNAPEMRKQHIDRLERIIDMLETSLEDDGG